MPTPSTPPVNETVPVPSFGEALRFWLKLGFISFGGPSGQIAIMHRELVETKRWISEGHFGHALNFCMLLPGPEAQQLATYLGWRMHGARGGIAAGALFVIPSMFVLFALSWIYMTGGDLPWLAAIFHGLLGAVIAVVFEAVPRIGRRALKSATLWVIAVAAFIAIHFGAVSFVWIVLGAALLGWLGRRLWPGQFPAAKGHGNGSGKMADHDSAPVAVLPPAIAASWPRSLRVILLCGILWWTPVFALAAWLGWDSTPAQQGLFFSRAALVTFGGAYAVLPYVAQQAVENYAWLSHPQMMAGLALAETTPGPLIMVLQFVGFAGGWQHPGGFSPLAAATIGSLITTWVTFLPCFLFIFLGGPHVEKIGTLPRISAALAAITAAVVGVILSLAVTLTQGALWDAATRRVDWPLAALAILSFVALQRRWIGLIPLIGLCGLAGWLGWAVR
jgi:chromate transporter